MESLQSPSGVMDVRRIRTACLQAGAGLVFEQKDLEGNDWSEGADG